MDSISETRLSLVNPILATKVHMLADVLAEEKIIIRVVQGLRSWNEQDRLYAQGRTTPGKVITNCPGGHSWHCYGLAVDVCPNDASKALWTADWNARHPAWTRIHEVAESFGFVCGSDFRTFVDNPHIQLTGRFGANPDSEAQNLLRNQGMETVWNEAFLS
jgi:peptidoglycan LD-endopeptidase CwlK